MSNMTLEAILEELCRYGLPSLHPYYGGGAGKRDHTKPPIVGLWDCHIQVPYNDAAYKVNPYHNAEGHGREYDRRHKTPVGFRGKGTTAKQAAAQCLDRVLLYQEHGWHYLWPEDKRPASVPALETVE
jgi:hypothetical protein